MGPMLTFYPPCPAVQPHAAEVVCYLRVNKIVFATLYGLDILTEDVGISASESNRGQLNEKFNP